MHLASSESGRSGPAGNVLRDLPTTHNREEEGEAVSLQLQEPLARYSWFLNTQGAGSWDYKMSKANSFPDSLKGSGGGGPREWAGITYLQRPVGAQGHQQL